MSYTADSAVDFGPSKTGLLTVGYTVLNWDGTVYIARTTTGVNALGHGAYGVTGIAIADGATHPIRWDTGETTPAYALDVAILNVQAALTAQGYTTTRASYLDTLNGLVSAIWTAGTRTLTGTGTLVADTAAAVWAATTRTLTALGFTAGGQVRLLSTPLVGGTLTLTRGAAYTGAQALTWQLDGTAPDLTGVTLTLEVGIPGETPGLSRTVTVSGTVGAQLLTAADITSVATTALPAGPLYRWAIWVPATTPDRWVLLDGPVILKTPA